MTRSATASMRGEADRERRARPTSLCHRNRPSQLFDNAPGAGEAKVETALPLVTKSSKTAVSLSGGIPTPVSTTSMVTLVSDSVVRTSTRPPGLVACTALTMRLRKTRPSAKPSAAIVWAPS